MKMNIDKKGVRVMETTICKDDLIKLGYKKYQAICLVREAKTIMVSKGYPYYNNKRLGRVPKNVIESILGVSLDVGVNINAE